MPGGGQGGGDGVVGVGGGGDDEVPAGVGLGQPGGGGFGQAVGAVDGEDEVDGHRRIDPVHDAVEAGKLAELDLGVDPAAPQMLGDRSRLGEIGVGLGVAAGGGAGVGAPVVEDPGDVGDPVGPLHQPQHEVVVLAAVEPRLEAAELDGQRPPVDPEMAGVHERRHVLGRPARLGVLWRSGACRRRRPRRCRACRGRGGW